MNVDKLHVSILLLLKISIINMTNESDSMKTYGGNEADSTLWIEKIQLWQYNKKKWTKLLCVYAEYDYSTMYRLKILKMFEFSEFC